MDISLESRKLNLINLITSIKDESLLAKMEKLINEQTEWYDELPDEVKDELELSIQEAARGELMSHEEVVENIRKRRSA